MIDKLINRVNESKYIPGILMVGLFLVIGFGNGVAEALT